MMHAAITDAQVKGVIHMATRLPGSWDIAAKRLGLSRPHLYGIMNGNAPITQTTRDKILAAIREEELALADKIAAEWGW